MLLSKLSHSRTGDKGNIVTISLIAYRHEDFRILEREVGQLAADPRALLLERWSRRPAREQGLDDRHRLAPCVGDEDPPVVRVDDHAPGAAADRDLGPLDAVGDAEDA